MNLKTMIIISNVFASASIERELSITQTISNWCDSFLSRPRFSVTLILLLLVVLAVAGVSKTGSST